MIVKTEIGFQFGWSRPSMTNDSSIDVRAASHPLVSLVSKKSFIKNHIRCVFGFCIVLAGAKFLVGLEMKETKSSLVEKNECFAYRVRVLIRSLR